MKLLVVPLALLLAGCAESPTLGSAALAAPEPAVALAAAPVAFTWEGYLKAGAAFEMPAHFYPSDQYAAPLWDAGFVFEILEAPELLEIRLDWTSAGPSELLLMVHGPHGAEAEDEPGWSQYSTYDIEDALAGRRMASAGPLCMGIPKADIEGDLARVAEAGAHHGYDGAYWYPMAHSSVGVDIRLTFTVTSVGGDVRLSDALHGHDSNGNEFQNAVETELGPKRAWLPCEISGTAQRGG